MRYLFQHVKGSIHHGLRRWYFTVMEATSISYHCLETRVDKWNDYDVNIILKIRDTKICLLAAKNKEKTCQCLMENGLTSVSGRGRVVITKHM